MKRQLSRSQFVVDELRRYRRTLFYSLPGVNLHKFRYRQKYVCLRIVHQTIKVAKVADPVTLWTFVEHNRHGMPEPYQAVWRTIASLLGSVYDFRSIKLDDAIEKGHITVHKGESK